MKSIGGYFELELHKGSAVLHDTPLALKNGRSSFLYILELLKPRLVHIPYFTCDSLLEPFEVAGVPYQFYHIDRQLELTEHIDVQPGEYIVYINYLDLKRPYIDVLSKIYGDRLIIDATQAYFMKGDGRHWLFNSCRKFFGVPDGSYLYAPLGTDVPAVVTHNEDYVTDHLIKRFNGHTRAGYNTYMDNEHLCSCSITGMSVLSERLLSMIDYNAAIAKRRANYAYLHQVLQQYNLFDAALDTDNVPMHYPLFLEHEIDKGRLVAQDIFVTTFWPHVWERNTPGFETETWLAKHLVPVPVDHRLDQSDLDREVAAILKLIG